MFNQVYVSSKFITRTEAKEIVSILKKETLVISLLNSRIVVAISGAFIRLLTSFITSALLERCPTVLAMAAKLAGFQTKVSRNADV